MISRLLTLVDTTNRWLTLAFASGLLLVFGLLDYLAGEEIASSIFYLIPVAIVGWRFSVRTAGGFAITAALVSVAVTMIIGIEYSSVLIAVWNGFSRFLVYFAFSLLLGHVRSSLDHARSLALTDHLTGLANGRYFAELAKRELEHCRRYRRPFTLAYIDIDDLKDINDAVGHSGGDRVIQSVARALKSSVRKVDQVARQGGDEFMLFLHEVDGRDAESVLCQIHERAAAILEKEGITVSLSIGGVTWYTPPATLDAGIQSADRMMYEVKRTRKGSVLHRSIGWRLTRASDAEAPDLEDGESAPGRAPQLY